MNVQLAIPDIQAFALPGRTLALESLSAFREEWEVAADDDSLLDVSASVGLMLFDVTTKLGLTPEEQTVVLGGRLYSEIIAMYEGESTQ
jgi:hypothetical protein